MVSVPVSFWLVFSVLMVVGLLGMGLAHCLAMQKVDRLDGQLKYARYETHQMRHKRDVLLRTSTEQKAALAKLSHRLGTNRKAVRAMRTISKMHAEFESMKPRAPFMTRSSDIMHTDMAMGQDVPGVL